MSKKVFMVALMSILSVPFTAVSVSAQTLPSGMQMLLRLDTPLSTRINNPGDQFTATIVEPGDYSGDIVYGHVRNVNPSGKLQGRTEMSLAFDSIRFRNGQVAPFPAQVSGVRESDSVKIVDSEGRIISGSRTGQTEKRAGIGAALGGVLGGALGGGKGALLGVLLGAGAGAGSLYAQGAREIRLDPGTEIDVQTGFAGRPRALARTDLEQNPQFVMDVQRALSDDGYNVDIDGQLGWRTREAIRQYQSDQGLPVTGTIDRETADSLGVQ